jgi:hypothetical protein
VVDFLRFFLYHFHILYLLPNLFSLAKSRDMMGGTSLGKQKNHAVVGLENVKRRALIRCLHLDGTVMLKLTFEKQVVMWIGLKWLRMGFCNRLWRITVSWPRKNPVIKFVV